MATPSRGAAASGRAGKGRAGSAKARRPARKARRTARAPRGAARKPTVRTVIADAGTVLAELGGQAAQNTLAATPLIGIRGRDVLGSAATLARQALKQPRRAAKEAVAFVGATRKIVAGTSEAAPDPKDRRFADPAWRENGLYRRWVQAHMALGDSLNRFVDGAGMDELNAARSKFVISLVQDAIAPSNFIVNPAALKKAVDTGGASLGRGLKNLVRDLRENGGLPSQVDRRPFELGKNLATTPGAVIFRTEVFELIQYQPATPRVRARPLLIVPPQINKFYVHDLSLDKSIVNMLLAGGIQPYIISWRNPTRELAHLGLEDYVEAIDKAVDVIREISRSDDINIWGACSGGITMSAFLATRPARDKRVNSATVAVCLLDIGATRGTTAGLFMTPETVGAAKLLSREQGVLEGAQMARMFAWMRPNDLIWNYWVNNYLLGNDPPAFDILYWNNDTTRLPARLHGDLLDLIETNPFVHPRSLKLGKTWVDMRKVDLDAYVIAGSTDHITPWTGCYGTARLYGPRTTFVLSNSGHIQALLNPPGNPKAFFVAGPAGAETPEAWVPTGVKHDGSWWPHWREWLQARSGDEVDAPTSLGSARHAPICAAPGEYVLEK